MVFSLTWLPDVLDTAGLKVAEVPDWRNRGRREMGRVRGVMVHHTVGARDGNMPSLDLLVKGRPDLSGPLAQLGLGRDGTFYVIAAGRANHAGEGKWRGVITGNSSFIGIECENTGRPDDPWPAVQMDALRRGVAALLKHAGSDSSMVCGHKEYATPAGRKPDPLWDMAPFRESVAALMAGGVSVAPSIPARDGQSRPTLRRGATGDLVTRVQLLLQVEAIGRFGPKTEAAVRAFQRIHDLVPDGIVGPKTWLTLDEAGLPVSQTATAPPQPPVAPPPTSATPNPPIFAVLGTMPPPDNAANKVKVDGGTVVSPNGVRFASRFKLGFMTIGATSVRSALTADPAIGAGIDARRLAVVAAISGNEGNLEAINSWDLAFMSFGIMQWTVGQKSDPGELAALLALLKNDDSGAFADCFGRFGIDVSIGAGQTTGFMVHDGRRLDGASKKAALRSPEWAYRFWRAGHHPATRRAQLRHAAGRIDRVVGLKVAARPLHDWLTSQVGIALLLDQHVNRPGHVPATLEAALAPLLAAGTVPKDPAQWDDDDERRVLERYVIRRASTSMTHSQKRAERIFDAAVRGLISSARGSFA